MSPIDSPARSTPHVPARACLLVAAACVLLAACGGGGAGSPAGRNLEDTDLSGAWQMVSVELLSTDARGYFSNRGPDELGPWSGTSTYWPDGTYESVVTIQGLTSRETGKWGEYSLDAYWSYPDRPHANGAVDSPPAVSYDGSHMTLVRTWSEDVGGNVVRHRRTTQWSRIGDA